MKSYKQILEAKKETVDNPLVFVYTDEKGDHPLAHMLLVDSANLHSYDAAKVLGAKDFLRGAIIKTPAKWGPGKFLFIQINPNSNFVRK